MKKVGSIVAIALALISAGAFSVRAQNVGNGGGSGISTLCGPVQSGSDVTGCTFVDLMLSTTGTSSVTFAGYSQPPVIQPITVVDAAGNFVRVGQVTSASAQILTTTLLGATVTGDTSTARIAIFPAYVIPTPGPTVSASAPIPSPSISVSAPIPSPSVSASAPIPSPSVSASAPAPSPSASAPTIAPTQGPLTASPSSATFAYTNSAPQTIALSSANFSGAFAIASNSNSGVASGTISGSTLTITPTTVGSTVFGLTAGSKTLNVNVTVSAQPAISLSPSTISFTSPTAAAQTSTITSPGYSGSCSATPSNADVTASISASTLTVTPAAAGSGTVAVTCGLSSANLSFTVQPPAQGAVTFNPTTASIATTTSSPVTVAVSSANYTGNYTIGTSSNPAVATASLSGSTITVTPGGTIGTATVVAAAGSKTASLSITVTDNPFTAAVRALSPTYFWQLDDNAGSVIDSATTGSTSTLYTTGGGFARQQAPLSPSSIYSTAFTDGYTFVRSQSFNYSTPAAFTESFEFQTSSYGIQPLWQAGREYVYIAQGKLYFYYTNPQGLVQSSFHNYADNVPHTVMTVIDTPNLAQKLYIDGSLVASGTFLTAPATGSSPPFLGGGQLQSIPGGTDTAVTLALTGSVDDTAVFPSALSSATVANLYSLANNGATPVPAPTSNLSTANYDGEIRTEVQSNATSNFFGFYFPMNDSTVGTAPGGATCATGPGTFLTDTEKDFNGLYCGGVTYVPGKFTSDGSGAMAFDGSTGYARSYNRVMQNACVAASCTFGGWFSTAGSGATYNGVLLSESLNVVPSTGTSRDHVVYVGASGKLNYWNGSTGTYLQSTASVADGANKSWVVTHKFTSTSSYTDVLYVNGVAVNNATVAGAYGNSTDYWYIGWGYTTNLTDAPSNPFFQGVIGKTFFIPNVALTAAQVQSDYALASSTTVNPAPSPTPSTQAMPTATPSPTAAPTQGPVVANPTSLDFPLTTTASKAVALSSANYTGAFTVTPSATGIVSASLSGSTLTVTPVTVGSVTLSIAGGTGAAASVAVTVDATPSPMPTTGSTGPSPAPTVAGNFQTNALAFHPLQYLQLQEVGSTGGSTVTTYNGTVANDASPHNNDGIYTGSVNDLNLGTAPGPYAAEPYFASFTNQANAASSTPMPAVPGPGGGVAVWAEPAYSLSGCVVCYQQYETSTPGQHDRSLYIGSDGYFYFNIATSDGTDHTLRANHLWPTTNDGVPNFVAAIISGSTSPYTVTLVVNKTIDGTMSVSGTIPNYSGYTNVAAGVIDTGALNVGASSVAGYVADVLTWSGTGTDTFSVGQALALYNTARVTSVPTPLPSPTAVAANAVLTNASVVSAADLRETAIGAKLEDTTLGGSADGQYPTDALADYSAIGVTQLRDGNRTGVQGLQNYVCSKTAQPFPSIKYSISFNVNDRTVPQMRSDIDGQGGSKCIGEIEGQNEPDNPSSAAYSLTAAISAGDTTFNVNSNGAAVVGTVVHIGSSGAGQNIDTVTVTAVSGNTVTVSPAFTDSYPTTYVDANSGKTLNSLVKFDPPWAAIVQLEVDMACAIHGNTPGCNYPLSNPQQYAGIAVLTSGMAQATTFFNPTNSAQQLDNQTIAITGHTLDTFADGCEIHNGGGIAAPDMNVGAVIANTVKHCAGLPILDWENGPMADDANRPNQSPTELGEMEGIRAMLEVYRAGARPVVTSTGARIGPYAAYGSVHPEDSAFGSFGLIDNTASMKPVGDGFLAFDNLMNDPNPDYTPTQYTLSYSGTTTGNRNLRGSYDSNGYAICVADSSPTSDVRALWGQRSDAEVVQPIWLAVNSFPVSHLGLTAGQSGDPTKAPFDKMCSVAAQNITVSLPSNVTNARYYTYIPANHQYNSGLPVGITTTNGVKTVTIPVTNWVGVLMADPSPVPIITPAPLIPATGHTPLPFYTISPSGCTQRCNPVAYKTFGPVTPAFTPPPTPSPIPSTVSYTPKSDIWAMGDSITAGAFINGAAYAYPATVGTHYGVTVHNLAVSGKTISYVISGEQPQITAPCDTAMVNIGTNDAKGVGGETASQFDSQLASLITTLQGQCTHIAVMTVMANENSFSSSYTGYDTFRTAINNYITSYVPTLGPTVTLVDLNTDSNLHNCNNFVSTDTGGSGVCVHPLKVGDDYMAADIETAFGS